MKIHHQKRVSELRGYSVPNSRLYNAKECLFEIKFQKVNEEIRASREQILTPRANSNSDLLLSQAMPRLQHSQEVKPKIVEFYSPVYLAAIVLKNGVNSSEEQIKKYGLLERLDKSFDFSLLPH